MVLIAGYAEILIAVVQVFFKNILEFEEYRKQLLQLLR
jgi:hypothetical protein